MRAIISILLLTLLHSCSAPLYSVMPNDLTMLEKTGQHGGGFSFSNSMIWSTMTQFGGHYAYALPYGLRARADFNLLTGGGRGSQWRSRSLVQSYGLGLGYHKAFSERVKWESHLMIRRVSGRYFVVGSSSNEPDFIADYGANNLNLFTGIRVNGKKHVHSEIVVGYQWTYLDPIGMVENALGSDSFTRKYGEVNTLHHPVVSLNTVYDFEDVQIMLFLTFNVYSGESMDSGSYNSSLLGLKFTKLFNK